MADKRTIYQRRMMEKAFAAAFDDAVAYQTYFQWITNPDPTLNYTADGARKGMQLFREMTMDPHITAVMQQRLSPVINCGYTVDPASDAEIDVRAADFIKAKIDDHYDQLSRFVLNALGHGFSVAEIMWSKNGSEIHHVEERQQHRFRFDKDGLPYLLRNLTTPDPLPDRKFVIATWDQVDDNRYGQGVLSKCFWSWWYKKHGVFFWSNYVEKYLAPAIIGQYPPNADQALKDALQEAVEAIQQDFGGIIPQNSAIQVLNLAASGRAASHKEFVEYQNGEISKAWLSSTLSVSESEYGTRAQAEVHADTSSNLIPDTAKFLQRVLNQTIVPWLVDWNFSVSAYPKLLVQYQDDTLDKDGVDKLIALSKDGGIELKTEEVYEKIGMTAPQDGDEVMAGGKVYKKGEKPPEPQLPPGLNPFQPGQNPQSQVQQQQNQDQQEFAEALPDVTATYRATDNVVDSLYDAFKRELVDAQNIKGLEKLLGKVKTPEDLNEALDKYKPDLRPVMVDTITLGRLLGLAEAEQVLDIQEYAEAPKAARIAVVLAGLIAVQNMNVSSAAAYLRKKITVDGSTWKNLSDQAKATAFHVADIESLALRNTIKESLVMALSEGKQFPQWLAEVKEQISAVMGKAGMTVFQDHHLRTVYFTNLYAAMSAARTNKYKADGVQALRYDTMDDSRVRPEHAVMHGFVAPIDDPIWEIWTPPNGYGCRCRTTPVRALDIYQMAPDAKPDEGFKNNPAGDMSELINALLRSQRYGSFLTNAIAQWMAAKVPNYGTVPGLSEMPVITDIPQTIDELRDKLSGLLGGKLAVRLPEQFQQIVGSDVITIDDDFLRGLLGKSELIASIMAIAEVMEDPLEILSEMPGVNRKRHKFMLPFAGGQAAMVVVDGEKMRIESFRSGTHAAIQAKRRGIGGPVYER